MALRTRSWVLAYPVHRGEVGIETDCDRDPKHVHLHEMDVVRYKRRRKVWEEELATRISNAGFPPPRCSAAERGTLVASFLASRVSQGEGFLGSGGGDETHCHSESEGALDSERYLGS